MTRQSPREELIAAMRDKMERLTIAAGLSSAGFLSLEDMPEQLESTIQAVEKLRAENQDLLIKLDAAALTALEAVPSVRFYRA